MAAKTTKHAPMCLGSGDGRSANDVHNRRTVCSICHREVGIVERGRWARANQPFQVARHVAARPQAVMFKVRWRLDLSSTEVPDRGINEDWAVLAHSEGEAIRLAKASQLEASSLADIEAIEESMPGKMSWTAESIGTILKLGTS